jgi:hypothetical protein
MKRFLLIYLASYLFFGGVGFAFLPELTLKLFLSNGAYGDIMPRAAGMFMIALSGLIAMFVIRRDYTYYPYSIFARTGIVGFMVFLFLKSGDPLFLILIAIVLVGLLPSIWLFLTEREADRA